MRKVRTYKEKNLLPTKVNNILVSSHSWLVICCGNLYPVGRLLVVDKVLC